MMPTSSSVPGPDARSGCLELLAGPRGWVDPDGHPSHRRADLTSSAGAGSLRCPRRIASRPGHAGRPGGRPASGAGPAAGRRARSAGCPPSAPGSSPGMTWPWRSCVMRGRSRSMTLVSPRPRWSGQACSPWTAPACAPPPGPFRRAFRRDEVHARLTSFTRAETGRLVSPSSRAVRPNCAGRGRAAGRRGHGGGPRARPSRSHPGPGLVRRDRGRGAGRSRGGPGRRDGRDGGVPELAASLREVIAAPGSAYVLSTPPDR